MVLPSFSTLPVILLSNKEFLISAPSLVEDRDAEAAKRDHLIPHHVDVALLHLVTGDLE